MPTLTQRLVSSVKARKTKYEITCTALPGFILRVLPSGKKIYYARLRHDGKDVRERIGRVEEVSFRDARARAGELLTCRVAAPVTTRAAAKIEVVDTTPTMREFVHRYTSGHLAIALKPGTARCYTLIIKNHILPRFGGHRLSEIRREEIEQMVGAMMQAPQAARSTCVVLSSIFTKAVQWGVLPVTFFSPTRGVKTKPARMCERFLTPAERVRLEEVLEAGLTRAKLGRLHWSIVGAIRLLALTGMRSGEVFGLTWDMVDLEHRVFRLPDSKTGQKTVPFSSAVAKLLVSDLMPRRGDKPWVLVSNVGTAVSKEGVGRAWRRIRVTARLGEIRVHDLRHSFASDALMSGVPLAVVGKVLGHRKPQTTARYAHISDAVISDALERATARIVGAQREEANPLRKREK